MKILIVSEFFPKNKQIEFSGGVEARVYFVAKFLAKKHQVTVLTSLLNNSSKEEELEGFKVIRVGPQRFYQATTGDIFSRLKFLINAVQIGSRLDVDIVEGSNFLTHFVAKQISLNKKIPVVAWYPDVWIGNWIKNAGIAGILGEILERFNLKRGFDGYISISNSTTKKLHKFIKKDISIISCGVDFDEFKLPIKENKKSPTILSIARLVPYKNQQILIKALSKIPEKMDARLIIVGSGPMLLNLENLADKLGIKRKVEFLSNLNRKELVDLIKSCYIFSLPSKVEGFGIVTIEAAAAGLPYVNSNIEVQQEVTKNGLGGFLVDPEDEQGFVEAFIKLISDDKLYRQKSQNAKKLATYYDWQKISKQTEEVYQKLL